jgi:hypothetical protein
MHRPNAAPHATRFSPPGREPLFVVAEQRNSPGVPVQERRT